MQRRLMHRRHQITLALDKTHGIETILVPDERDETIGKQNRKQSSRIKDAVSDNRSRLV